VHELARLHLNLLQEPHEAHAAAAQLEMESKT
jgi:hypothetical protein